MHSTKASSRPFRHSRSSGSGSADLATIDGRFAPHLEARDVVKSQLEDLAFFLRSYSAGIDASPERLQEIEDRLALIERLKKKHGPSLDDVIAKAASLRQDLNDLAHGTERTAEIDAALAAARASFLTRAEALSKKRTAAATALSSALERSLADLAMARTRCEVRFVRRLV